MIIKIKDLLFEDITIRNPKTNQRIKATSALTSDDPTLVKKAKRALGMDSGDTSTEEPKKQTKISSNPYDDKDKSDSSDEVETDETKSVIKTLKQIKKISEKLVTVIKSKKEIDKKLNDKIDHSLNDMLLVHGELKKKG
tara:strand:- start:2154 stop:2570 length:417 start_codon:yes stop_codon:yes gene_type:complete